jgi:hypothetical protein
MERTSPFFNLPLELREQVYTTALCTLGCGPDLLRTCREIHDEARKFLYQRPLIFRSQGELYTWLANTPLDLLDHVSEVILTIYDVDLMPIFTQEPPVDRPHTPPRLLTWNLYQAELRMLESSLRKLSKVKTITICAPADQHSFLYREFLTSVLQLLSALYPDLRDLRLVGNFHHQELTLLSNLAQLESFSFDGFSASLPITTADILRGLKYLKHLSLFSQPAMLTPITAIHSQFTTKRQVTGDVMRTISQLASFTVNEGAPAATTPWYFTSELLTSLHGHSGLNSLSIHLSQTPEEETLVALETFLDDSSIERLELDWPDLQLAVLETYTLLTTTLKVLWVRARSEADAFEILWSLFECREAGELCSLEKVVLIRSTEDYNSSLACSRKDSGIGDWGFDICDVRFSLLLPYQLYNVNDTWLSQGSHI